MIAARSDLGMSRGKLAAQVAHAAVAAALDAHGTEALDAWLEDGQGKVVVRVPSPEALQEVIEKARRAGIRTNLVADAGRTQLPPGTKTCCAFGPAPEEALDAVTGDLRLL